MPNLAALCGIKLETKELDGKSLMQIIINSDSETLHAGGIAGHLKICGLLEKGSGN